MEEAVAEVFILDYEFFTQAFSVLAFGIGCIFGSHIQKSFNFFKW